MVFTTETRDFLKERLNRAEISIALVVDDAFDTPTVDRLQAELSDFWNLIERDDDLLEALKSLGVEAEFEDDLDDEALATLWANREDSSPLIDHANSTLFANAITSLDSVERIVGSLEELGLEVDRAGTDYSDPTPVTGLVFMDYYLGNPSDPTSSELSAIRAREIYDAPSESSNKPFIVLMSSLPEVGSQAERFREDSDLLGGLFDFVPRDDLNDPTRFALKMASWTSNMPLRHKIQNFVDTLDSTLCDRTQEFMRKAKSLTIEDYSFVQALSLQDDGHPLGDYMQWLLSSLLVNKVFEDNERFATSRNAVNKVSFDSSPPSQYPSLSLAEIYSIAIAEPNLADVQRHPRVDVAIVDESSAEDPGSASGETSSGTSAVSQAELPLLRLGDLLVNGDQQKVYMVATPDCDLQFAPDAKRVLDPQNSVLLIPGRLQPLSKTIGSDQIQTELYFHDGEQFRIVWDRKKILTIRVREFFGWCSREGFCRPARIRLPYAVKIQQEVITGLSRVGMPVAPPLQDFVPVEILAEAIDGLREFLGPPVEPGVNVLYTDQDDPKIVVTPTALDAILDSLNAVIARYEGFLQGESDLNRQRRFTSKINRLNRLMDEPAKLATIVERKHDLPNSGEATPLVDHTIGIHRNARFPGRCSNNHVICLNFSYD